MAVDVDFSQLEKYVRKLQKAAARSPKAEQAIDGMLHDIAGAVVNAAEKNTPVGVYPSGSGRVGGTLRRAWRAEDPKTLPVERTGNEHRVTVSNNTEYASYVEFGHRTPNHGGWVEGKHMLAKAEEETRRNMDKLIEKRLDAFARVIVETEGGPENG